MAYRPSGNYVQSVLIISAMLAALELIARAGIPVPNPAVITLTTVVYVTFTGGMGPGLASGAVALFYAAYFFSLPGSLFRYSEENVARMIVLFLATPAMIVMVGVLKRRNDRLIESKDRLIDELQDAVAKIQTLEGILPICASCKKIRDAQGSWSQMESYITGHSQAQFSHGLCPDCAAKAYEDLRRLKDQAKQT